MTGADSPDDLDDVDDLYDLGYDLAEAGDHDRAAEVFRRAALRGCAAAWLGLGTSLTELRRWEEAAEAFEEAGEAGEEDAWLDLALVLLQLGRWVDAEQAALHALDGGDGRAWGALGSALLGQGARPAAMLAFGRAAELGVNGGIEGAHLLREAGRADDAEAWARRASDAGDPAAAALLLAWKWEATRDAGLEVDLRVHADRHASARVALADLLRSAGRVEDACAVLEAGALRGEVESWLPLGNLHLEEHGDQVAAEAAYRGGIEGGDLFSHTNLAMLLRDRGEEAEAVEHLTIAAAGGDELAARLLRDLPG